MTSKGGSALDKAEIVEVACEALRRGDKSLAAEVVRSRYPHIRPTVGPRSVPPDTATRVFLRDGFTDRYSGTRLVFPPVLKAISRLIRGEFPYHPNWKMTECHIAYWELSATVDHVVPIARGGSNDETNLVTTSQLRNSAKANWTLEELGWTLSPPGNDAWDGLTSWLRSYVRNNPEILREDSMIRRWFKALERVSGE